MRAHRIFLCLTMVLFVPAVAQAVPSLQLYAESGTYDFVTETWITNDNPFTLYVAGAKSPSNISLISDVTLSVAVPTADYNTSGSITIQGAPGEPANVLAINEILGSGGLAPDGSPGTPPGLPTHGIYPAFFWSIDLPDLLVDTAGETVMDYQPGGSGSVTGDIQFYIVTISGFPMVHFDLQGVIHKSNGKTQNVKAPFSHDAEFNSPPQIPAPPALLLAIVGVVGVTRLRKRGS